MVAVVGFPTRAAVLTAEALGTHFVVWLGAGTQLATKAVLHPHQPLDATEISIAFGFALLVAVYALAGISGAHFNPVVSTSSPPYRWSRSWVYILDPLAGAM